ncbi:MAG TPA: AAA family ATPase [Solirubrobacterales bacterium]|nr:AAA family ATPase [Solirubrobacterales bacterium]
MSTSTPLVGRANEIAALTDAFERAREGSGSLVLVAGEAGVGKSSLAREAAALAESPLWGAASEGVTAAYGPIVAALRSRLRNEPGALAGCGPLLPHLALLLPELGEPATESDRATIFESIRCALAHLGTEVPAVVVLDDLQWSDDTTLELLAALAEPLQQMPVLVVAAYRTDGLPREHRLRWLRNELRRGGNLRETTLEPLDRDGVARLLTELLPEDPSSALVRTVHDRTLGSPFFVGELVAALNVRNSLRPGPRGLELAERSEVPIPDSIKEAVLVGSSDLSPTAREAAEVAAVIGQRIDLELASEFAPEDGLAELLEAGLLEEGDRRQATFRHALAQEALYAEVPWMRRRDLHRRLAEALATRDGSSLEIATHWLGAGEEARAREALVAAGRESESLHAHRDAVRAARQALELWPGDEAEELRAETLARYGRCAELTGDLSEAVKAWRELAAVRERAGDRLGQAEAQRRLAAVLGLSGEWEQAQAARRLAAEGFASAGRPAEAALERLALADHHRRRAEYGEAIAFSQAATEAAEEAERVDIVARVHGLRGVVEAKGGDYERGLESVRGGLSLALEHDLTPIAAELYQRLSLVLYDGADYRQAEEALDTALDLCRTDPDAGTEVACVTCLVYVLRERGEWARAEELGRELIESDTAIWVAEGLIGAIHAFEGKLSSARRLLTASREVSSTVRHFNMYVDSTTSLAIVAAAEGLDDEVTSRCRELLARWEESEDHHYAVWGVRWAASWFARQGRPKDAQLCAAALGKMAAEGGHDDAVAALAQAVGELALLEGDATGAADSFSRAVELHRNLAIPHERAQVELRAGVALAAAGERDEGLERLCDAYRCATKLGARPLAAEAAKEVAALGESVAQRLGSRAAAASEDGAQLTRRELEVLRHVAVGRTNREIAQELFISQRTVDMHVRNLLGKLDCRSRVEASHRAGELGLLN